MNNLLNFSFLFTLSLPLVFIIGVGPFNISFLVISIISIYLISKDKKFIFESKLKKFYIFFLILYVYLLFNSYISEYKDESFSRSVPYIKYLFLILLCDYISTKVNNDNYQKNLKIIFWIYSLVFFIVFLFIVLELSDIDFGFIEYADVDYRLSGPFGDEAIVGSFILAYMFYYAYLLKEFQFNRNISIIFLVISFFSILLSGERMSFIMLVFCFLIYFIHFSIFKIENNKLIFIKKYLGIILILPLLIACVFLVIKSTLNEERLDSYKFRMNQTLGELKNFEKTSYFTHFKTSYFIFMDNKIIGKGVKSFRYECGKEIYDFVDNNPHNRCRTHPHNIYLEILSEIGIIGFLLLSINFYFLLRELFKKNNFYNNFFLYLPIIYYLWPLKTSGSFFSSIYGSLIWYFIAFFIIVINSRERIQ